MTIIIINIICFVLGIIFALFIIPLINPIVDVIISRLECTHSENAKIIAKNNAKIEEITQKNSKNPIVGFKDTNEVL